MPAPFTVRPGADPGDEFFGFDALGNAVFTRSVRVLGGLETVGAGGQLWQEKLSDQAVANSTTLVDATDLYVECAADAVYQVTLQLIWSSSEVADINWRWLVPLASVFQWHEVYDRDFRFGSNPKSADGAGEGVAQMSTFFGVLHTVGAGVLQFQFAQNNLENTATIVGTGSLLIADRLA